MPRRGSMAKHLEKIRVLIHQRQKATELAIKEELEKLLQLYFSYLSEEFAMYSENGILDYATLQRTGRLDQLMEKLDAALRSPASTIPGYITQLAEETYGLSYLGLRQAAAQAAMHPVIKAIADESFVNEYVLKRSLTQRLHPLAGFNQKMWRQSAKQLRKVFTDAFMRGDRYETIAKAVQARLGITMRRANTVVRTEVHRITEIGRNDSAKQLNKDVAKAIEVHKKLVETQRQANARAAEERRKEAERKAAEAESKRIEAAKRRPKLIGPEGQPEAKPDPKPAPKPAPSAEPVPTAPKETPPVLTAEEKPFAEVILGTEKNGEIPPVPEMVQVKTWKSKRDARVRHGKHADHRKNHNQTVRAEDKFQLVGGFEADAPGSSGNAANDINCRCTTVYDWWDTSKPMPHYEEQGDPWKEDEEAVKEAKKWFASQQKEKRQKQREAEKRKKARAAAARKKKKQQEKEKEKKRLAREAKREKAK